MSELDLSEEKNKAKTFNIYKTYVFVRTTSDFYNGYILSVENDSFTFMDDLVPAPFPIRFDSLIAPIIPSKKVKK